MALTHLAPFAQSPLLWQAVCTAANTTLTGSPDDTVLLGTAGADGALLTALWAVPRATISATVVHVYGSADSGTTKLLLLSALLAADTVSTTDAPILVPLTHADGEAISEARPLYLPAGMQIYAGISVALADGVVVCAAGKQY